MAHTIRIHEVDFAARSQTAASSDSPALSSDDFSQLIENGDRPLAVVGHEAVTANDLEKAASADAEVTFVIADASAAAGGRGSEDLCAALWQSFPAVAAFASDTVLAGGGVVFSPEGLKRLESSTWKSAGDPIISAVTEIVAAGGTMRAVLVPGASDVALPQNPSLLSPPERSNASGLLELISDADPGVWLGKTASKADATAVKAGLLLWHDWLDESHRFSQSVEGKGVRHAGDYWHAIMHRRERDYGNSKYWFRRVGRHPVFESLAARCERFASAAEGRHDSLLERFAPGGTWNPAAFVDACSDAEQANDPSLDLLLRQIQSDEMLLLLWSTCLDARG